MVLIGTVIKTNITQIVVNQKFAVLPYPFMAKSISKKGPQATTKKAPLKKSSVKTS